MWQVPRSPWYQAGEGAIDVAGLIAVVSSARFQRNSPERTPPFSAAEGTWCDLVAVYVRRTSMSRLLVTCSSRRLERFPTRRELLSWMVYTSEGEAQGEVLWTSKEPDRYRASCRRGVGKASRRLRHVGRRHPFLLLDPEDLPPIGRVGFKCNDILGPGDWLDIVGKYSVRFEILRHRLALLLSFYF